MMSLSDTKEKSNFSKLSRLLIDGGTEVLRSIFDKYHPPATLSGTFHSHILVLTDLQRKRVLNRSQWDKLFPPGGVIPESMNFDITLLFILLRNICGLSPPSTGWDKLPSVSDTTLEANLARIKYFRNEVYGHISSTSIEDVKFESYWKDISFALVGLGLDQNEVDSLKSEPISKDYIKLLEEWTVQDRDLKEAILNTTAETRETRHVLQQQIRLQGEKMDNTVESLRAEIREQRGSSVPSECSNLAKYEFTGLVESLCRYRFPGTRQWILEKIQHHISNEEEQVIVITARPGVGKSVIAALTCQAMKEKGKLAACHFIEHGNSLRNTPEQIVESLASHLCESVIEFEEKLEEKLFRNKNKELKNMNCNELFTLLVEEPLNTVTEPSETALIVIDALDEIEHITKDEFVKALIRVAPKLPKWIKLVVTTRPMPNVIPNMHYVTVIDIEKCCNNNKEDINLYLFNHLQKIYREESREKLKTAAWRLCDISDGIFLFVYFAVKIIEEKKPSLSKVHTLVPTDISNTYEEYMKRIVKDLPIEEDMFFRFLDALAASKGRLPKSMALEILKINGPSRQERQEKNITLKALSHIFPVRNEHFTVFHKSLIDWLLESDEEQHDFVVKKDDGHRILAPLCFRQLQLIKSHETFPATGCYNECEIYALKYGFEHILGAGGFEKEMKICFTDLELFIVCVCCQFELDVVTENVKSCSPHFEEFIESCRKLDLIMCYRNQLQLYFQAAINCSEENELRKQAIHLLGTPKYHHIPYMEFTDGWEPPRKLLDIWCLLLDLDLDRKIALCIAKTSNNEHVIATFNTESRTCITFDVMIEEPFSCAISPASSRPDAAITTLQGVKLIELETLQTLDVIKTESTPGSCCFLSQEAQLAVGYSDCAVRIWDIRTLKLKTALIGHNYPVEICLPLQGNRLLTGDVRGTVLLWQSLHPDPKSVKLTDFLVINSYVDYSACDTDRYSFDAVSVSPDQTKIAIIAGVPHSFEIAVKLFSADDGNMLMQIDDQGYSVSTISFIDNSHILLHLHHEAMIINTDSSEKRHPKFCALNNILGPISRINKSELEFVACFYSFRTKFFKPLGFKFHNV